MTEINKVLLCMFIFRFTNFKLATFKNSNIKYNYNEFV